ncbi:MAG: hypothetical protein K2X47_16650 [Bdellovibrionales bacterium]|nr:hypothetical protein [Bdellovibrionales bacterium]
MFQWKVHLRTGAFVRYTPPMSRLPVLFLFSFGVLSLTWSQPSAAQSTTPTSISNYSALTRNDSVWQASLISMTLGSRFFFGASGHRKLSPKWSLGLRAGTALDFSSNQSFASAFGRWHPAASDHFFVESGMSVLSGISSGSQLFGMAVGTQLPLTTAWRGELIAGYEGIDRLFVRSAFSSWSTARIQIGLIRQL